MSSNKSAKNKLKVGTGIIKNGKVVQAQVLDFEMKEYDVIPLKPDNSEYNRARARRQTRKALEKYYEGEER